MKTLRLSILLSVLALAVTVSVAGAAPPEPIKFMMNPHVHGDLIAFSYQGDIWIVERDGTPVRRLTNHIARDVSPRFSPDGRHIAFSSNRLGNNDVYLVPVEGGEPTQITFHTTGDNVEGWTRDGRIMFATSRGSHPFFSPLYTVSPEGDLPMPMEMDQARTAAISPDGRYVAFNRSSVSTSRKGQKGNRTTDIWIMDREAGTFTKLTDPISNPEMEGFREHVHDAIPMWGADDMIYFMSERDGIFNIWKMAPDGGNVSQVTRHTQGGVKYPAISNDGRTIVYTNDHELYLLDVPNGAPQQVTVELSFDPSINQVEWVDVEDEADGFAARPDGDAVAVDSRGEIFLVPADPEEGEKKQITSSAWRDRYQKFSPDGAHLAFVSDEGGEEQLWVMEMATGERRKLTDHDSYKSTNYEWSPESDRIAFVAANRLFEVDVASGRTTELAYNENRGFNLSEYSADGRWLVYSRNDLDEDSEVYLFNIASQEEINVTQDPFRDYDGVLTPDGKHIVFRSSRDAGTAHLFVASLTALTEDPDDPLVKGRAEEEEEEEEEGERGEEEEAAPPPISVDTEGIRERASQLTSGDNSAGSYFLSADGETVYYTSRDEEGAGLFSIPIEGGESRKVASGSFGNIQPTNNRRTIFFSRGGEVHHMSLSSDRPEQVEFSFSVKVDHRAEWEQIFEEAWRVMKFRFYDPDMHGKDWDAIKAHYKPLLVHAGSYEDAHSLANQMIGELNASHVGVSGRSSVSMDREYATRLPGIELEPAQGAFRISHIYRDGPADKEWLDMEVGDFVLAIDGQEIRPPQNYWKILNHVLNDYVTLRVADSPGGSNARDQRVQTVTSVRNIQYQEWVEGNREYVEEESNGRIAYVHIRSMNQSSLEVFENEINRFWNAQGIIVDIRYNGGGNTDQQLLDILERRPYEYWNNRWSAPSSGRRPRQAIAGPKVMLINARSGSDSEVTPLGFRDLGLGSIVGNPTAAAVIATGSYGLIHGGSIRTPGSLVVNYDPTKPHNHGINLENYGVAPDVYVWNTPEDELAGYDRELKAAVDEALRMLSEGLWQYQGGGF
jgi:tricorn protease